MLLPKTKRAEPDERFEDFHMWAGLEQRPRGATTIAVLIVCCAVTVALIVMGLARWL